MKETYVMSYNDEKEETKKYVYLLLLN